ncbi:MAG: glycosyltransferase family 2 protein [Flavobacteriaceae bacterium]|nr:glycosyltransferase family 2 protein [Flavobacteriaceae bacterium]
MKSNLAIIIPFFKLAFFAKTLESLAHQTKKEFKVYIGDDASPEDCSQLLEKYDGKFDFVYHRFENNLGGKSLTQQWERCIALAQNVEWFMILGDDDYLGDTVVEEFYTAVGLCQNNSNVIRNASLLVNQYDDAISGLYKHPLYEDALASYCRKLNNETRSSLSEHIFKIESYKKFKFKDYKLAWSSDDRAIIDFADGKPILSTNAIVYVRMSDLNISGGTDNIQEKISGRLTGTQELIRDYKSIMTPDQIKLFIGLYENLIYRSKKTKFAQIAHLLHLSMQYFGFFYTVKQINSLFYKLLHKQELT